MLTRAVNAQPESGTDPMDITAVETTQITWDMRDRRFWPSKLTLWNSPIPRDNPTYEIGVMRYKGHVVLDCAGNPIRDFRIPLTVSSKVEGLRVEAWMRRDDRLTLGDIEARLWTKVRPDGSRVPMFDKRALSKRASNARSRAGLIGWVAKIGRDRQFAFLDSLRTPAQRASNLATDRDLTSIEKARRDHLGLNENRVSNAPTRQERIKKIKRRARIDDAVADPNSTAADAGPSDPAADASDDHDDLSDSTDGHEAMQEASDDDRMQASDDDTDDEGSLASSIFDPLDSRNEVPQSPYEEALLRGALGETVHDFFLLTERVPRPTNPRDNYLSQWSMVQEEFRIWWFDQGNVEEAPKLRARDRWTGGISEYRSAPLV